ncbi:amine dehydrogenase large subunit [Methyloceanibacter sp.]|uniref:amine dehydrogenase large subunit n=1 Tax=Methyloceanibacter sp. TaxID=1965321 RepID=UPI002084185B|nr:amine dehydrogenase large subunit [Methyloceanibacter sp.]GFO82814.1 MAG: hypothetical protein A49_24410 [Methyloceanibacter sp.]HML91080.1 amine dehydrogenase large subunit [Methyloceanibacter sp.]
MKRNSELKKTLQARWRLSLLSLIAPVLAIAAAPAVAQELDDEAMGKLDELITTELQDTPDIAKAPTPDARRMYVVDPAAFTVLSRIMPIDGNNGAYLGTVDTGLLALPVPSPKDGKLFMADTRFSVFSNGKRDDFIGVYDPVTLETPSKLIDIPDTRSGAMVHIGGASTSKDGKYLYSYQYAPANAVVIVDLENEKHLSTIEVPQCWYVYPAGERRFASHCRDGSFVLVKFDENGKEVSRTQTEPVHDPVKQPSFNNPAYDYQTEEIVLVSYWGDVVHLDFSQDEPKIGKSWSLVTEEQRKNGWAPGGWQPASYHSGSGRLYVLMDRRAKWAHTTESRSVWIYDTKSGERVQTIDLAHEAVALAVDKADKPYVYALSSHGKNLDIYDAGSGARLFGVDQLGHEPRLLVRNP